MPKAQVKTAPKKVAAKKASKIATKLAPAKVSTPRTKRDYKALPVEKVSRTRMVEVINSSKGRFLTTTHIDQDNQPRTMNVIKSNKPATALGYITVYSVQDKGYRNINPQTLTDVRFNGVHYQANRKPAKFKAVVAEA